MLRIRARRNDSKESGYMLLFLMMAVAVLTITMLGVAQNYRRGIQRDKEVEMMHRGEQYARAVQRYYHKFGRYPISIEQLENTNKIRFLRKKYKDPMSPDGSWKLAHPTDVKLKTPNNGLTPSGSGPGGLDNDPSATGLQSSSGSTGSSTAGSGTNQAADSTITGTTTTGTNAAGTNTGATTPGAVLNGLNLASGQVLGGGDLMGVVSKQKTEGVHLFGGKSKYNEWFFIYVAAQDRNNGSLIVGPYNPNMFVGSANSGLGNPTKSGSNNSPGGFGSTTQGPTSNSPTVPSTPTQ